MKRTMLSLVAVITLLAITGTAMADHRHRGPSSRGGVSVNFGRGGYYNSPYSNSYNSPYSNSYYSPYYQQSYGSYSYYGGNSGYYQQPACYHSGYNYYPQYYSRPGIQFQFGR